ncbi:Lrp/AsnC family transcriptional regulator [Streptosporangium amethystogenes]|uniref:Lrp/AsnC family transcriptional regulator n=1 Tax=Streptosporangium amethystogenes TaxID=2002 RepID=UPI000A025A4A|nr:Lrp/AsnC family transcriptional regulator [Streptosporangium amethystogenes]
MDDVDRKILAELQRDGRLTLTDLAERVRLSLSPCHRRLRALERSGAISGYHAALDAHALGLTFEALVFVAMRAANRATPGACPVGRIFNRSRRPYARQSCNKSTM